MIVISINAILTQKWTIFNKIDVLCLFNYIILKIVCFEQYIKMVNWNKSQQFGYILFLKLKFSFVHYKICWHLVVKVSVSVSLSICIIIKVSVSVLVSVSKKFKWYTALLVVWGLLDSILRTLRDTHKTNNISFSSE